MTVRATILGGSASLVPPRAVDADDQTQVVGSPGDGRVVLREPDGTSDAHRVLVLAAESRAAKGAAGPAGSLRLEVVVDGWRFEVGVEPEARAALRERARRDRGGGAESGPAEVRAIIPGVVVSVGVAEGDAVEAGDRLLVVEAMKMQNELRAPRSGTVTRVAIGERSTIEVGDLLAVIE